MDTFLNTDGTVKFEQKVSDTERGFGGTLDDVDCFGWSVAWLDDLNGDEVPKLVVKAIRGDDGGIGADADRGGLWILFIGSYGTVKSGQEISDPTGGFTGTLDDNDRFSGSIANMGDLDGDGISDLAVGTYREDYGGIDRGSVWILYFRIYETVKSERKYPTR